MSENKRIFVSAFDRVLDTPKEVKAWAYGLMKAANGALWLLTSGANGAPLSTPGRLDETGHADVVTALRKALNQSGLGEKTL